MNQNEEQLPPKGKVYKSDGNGNRFLIDDPDTIDLELTKMHDIK